jgi:hypothetical protein
VNVPSEPCAWSPAVGRPWLQNVDSSLRANDAVSDFPQPMEAVMPAKEGIQPTFSEQSTRGN